MIEGVSSETLTHWPRLLDHAFGDVSTFGESDLNVVEGYVHDIGHALLHFTEVRPPRPLRLDVKGALYGQTYRKAVHEEVLVIAAERCLYQQLKEPYFALDSAIVYGLHHSLEWYHEWYHARHISCEELERRIAVKAQSKRAQVLARRIDKTIRAAVVWAEQDLARNPVQAFGGSNG